MSPEQVRCHHLHQDCLRKRHRQCEIRPDSGELQVKVIVNMEEIRPRLGEGSVLEWMSQMGLVLAAWTDTATEWWQHIISEARADHVQLCRFGAREMALLRGQSHETFAFPHCSLST